ncbi:MAG: glucosyltransferase domain-containing protein [Clostridia bacterium]|nr:glucosyltransferase domain-containing protein [Clostridia bacterium]
MKEKQTSVISKKSDAQTRSGKTPFDLRKGLILLLVNVAALLPLCVFNGELWSVDSPSILLYGKGVHIGMFLDSYRYFGALIAQLYSFTGHNPIANCLPDAILFIILAATGTTVLVACVADHLKIRLWLPVIALDLAAVLAVENVWFCEILTFPESIFLSAIGLLMCFAAVIFFIRYRTVPGIILSAVCLILATAVYQQYIVVFTIFVIAVLGCEILGKENPSAKTAVIKYAGAAALILVSGAVYFLSAKAITNATGHNGDYRTELGPADILENIKYYILRQHSFLKGRGAFKTEIMTVSILFVAALWFVLFAVYVMKKKRPGAGIIVLAAFAAAYCSGYLPGIISKSHDTRVVFGLFSVFFLFVCGIVCLNKSKWIAPVVSCVLAAIFAANVFAIVRMANDQKKQNKADLEAAVAITQAIEDHEKNSGVTVTDIYYCYDTNQDKVSAWTLFSFDFSMQSILTLKSGKYTPGSGEVIYKVSEMPESIREQYFAGKDWKELDLSEQLIFAGDTAYLCVY